MATERVPPVVLQCKEMWSVLLTILLQGNIAIKKAKYQTLRVLIVPKDVREYRKLVSILDEKLWEYLTDQLPEEKSLRVVIRSIPKGITDDEIKEDLVEQEFHPIKVTRLRRQGNASKTPLLLMMVQLPREEKRILETKTIVHLRVRVETLRWKTNEGQCYNCQKYGHIQNKPHATPVCVKSGDSHSSRDCIVDRSTPARSGNCRGNNSASYGAWPENPKKQ